MRPQRTTQRRRQAAQEAGQALLELAIFGSLALLVLGALVSYGMNVDQQQQTQMEAIRHAMRSSSVMGVDDQPISTSHLVINERMIPDPSDAFAMGSLKEVSFSATNPVRTSFLGQAPEKWNVAEAPHLVIHLNGEIIDCPSAFSSRGGGRNTGCTQAGFRPVDNVRGFIWKDGKLYNGEWAGPIDKYNLIYGTGNVRPVAKRPPVKCAKWQAGECKDWSTRIVVMDDLDGDVLSPDIAITRCRQIIERPVCTRECLRSRPRPLKFYDSHPNHAHVKRCRNICNYSIEVPWYCDASNGPEYTSATFENLFADGVTALGIQPSTGSERSIKHTELRRREDATGVETTAIIHDWVDQKPARKFIFHDQGTHTQRTDLPPQDLAELRAGRNYLVDPDGSGPKQAHDSAVGWRTPWGEGPDGW